MRTKEQIVEEIKLQLEEKVAPMVAMHGGSVSFLDFDVDTGEVELLLSGSCSGCAGSSATLKYGVENLLTHYIPEVKSVYGRDDYSSMSQPFYSHSNFFPPDIDR
jgi:Fe-S cluster biogenesis protein NfuA